MKESVFILYIIIILNTTKLVGQSSTIATAKEHYKIDTTYKECLYVSENQVYQMVGCGDKAKEAWDEEMDKYYRLLMSVLMEKEREKLKTAQKNWLAYRESEYEFAGTTYYDLQGTIWTIVALDRKVEVVKHRAMELKNYYETLTEKDQK